jgi:hypothetical protein
VEELLVGLEKLWSGFLGIAAFALLIVVLFFLGSRFRGRFSHPAALLIFLGPAVLLLIMGLIVPAVRTMSASLQDASGNEFVGWANYLWIFDSQSDVIVNSLLWIVITPYRLHGPRSHLGALARPYAPRIGRQVTHLHADGHFLRGSLDHLEFDLRVPGPR